MIHKANNGTCQVSSGGTWLPGWYADERAANFALRFTNQQLAAFTHWSVRGLREDYRPVTFEELQALRRAVGSDETVVEPPSDEQRAADPDAAMCDWVRRQMTHMGMEVPGGDRG